MLDTILYSIIIILTSYSSFHYNFFLEMITIDGLFNAIHFMKTFVNKNLTESQIITKSNALYKGSLLDRYIYYLLIYIVNKTISVFFWLSYSHILYYISILTIIPPLI